MSATPAIESLHLNENCSSPEELRACTDDPELINLGKIIWGNTGWRHDATYKPEILANGRLWPVEGTGGTGSNRNGRGAACLQCAPGLRGHASWRIGHGGRAGWIPHGRNPSPQCRGAPTPRPARPSRFASFRECSTTPSREDRLGTALGVLRGELSTASWAWRRGERRAASLT